MSAIADDFASIAAGMRRSAAPAEDPVLVLYRRYREVEDAGDVVHARWKILRARLVEKFGEPRDLPCTAASLWEHDPSYAELVAVGVEADRLVAVSTDMVQQMMKTPAATLPGLLAKMTVGMSLWAPAKPADLQDFDEEAARAFMADAVRLLGEAQP
jgi:hypothetical protein